MASEAKPQRVVSQSLAELIDTKDNINNFCFRDQTLTGAEIENLCFDNCEFEHCRFNGEGMRSLTFADCFFHDCRFNSQPLRDCEFTNCRFYHSDNDTTVDFSYCDISMSKFIHCDLTRVDFKRASLYGCEMKTCKMVGVNFDTTTFSHVISNKVIIVCSEKFATSV